VVHDLTIELVDRPGALAEMGQALGAAESASRAVECSARGGRWGVQHAEGAGSLTSCSRTAPAAAEALCAAGITVLAHP